LLYFLLGFRFPFQFIWFILVVNKKLFLAFFVFQSTLLCTHQTFSGDTSFTCSLRIRFYHMCMMLESIRTKPQKKEMTLTCDGAVFISYSVSVSVFNESECIYLRERMMLIHECLTILYPSNVQKDPVDDGFSFLLSDFITHFLMPFYAWRSLILSLPSLQNILRFSTPCA